MSLIIWNHLVICRKTKLNKVLDMSNPGDDADKLHRIFITFQVEVLPLMDHTSSIGATFIGTYSTAVMGDLWVAVSRADDAKCERF
jgi:isoleucyl-tRNA synthetase